MTLNLTLQFRLRVRIERLQNCIKTGGKAAECITRASSRNSRSFARAALRFSQSLTRDVVQANRKHGANSNAQNILSIW